MTRELIVVRFGALGDLCLLAWSLAGGVRAGADRPRVTLVTKAAFAELMAAVPGVDEVLPLRGSRLRDLTRLARALRRRPRVPLIDAHGVLRARLLALLAKRPAAARIAKDTRARLALLLWRRSSPRLNRTMRQRFDELLRPYGLTPSGGNPAPPLRELGPAGASARTEAVGGSAAAISPEFDPAYERELPTGPAPSTTPVLGVAPGARWETKRWPAGRFANLIAQFRAHSAAPVRLILGPRESGWFPGSPLAAAAAQLDGVDVIRDQPLVTVARSLAACALTVTNDSGLLHLSEAVGTPVVAIFGPTVRAFGYTPTLPQSRLLEVDLECRPCSRNGKRPCWRGDLACLTGLAPERVLREVLDAVPWPGARPSAPGGSP